jgi:predicted nucleic acid-binding protein
MARRIDAYVDTSALIALTDRSDSYHDLFRRLFSDPPRLCTTTLVVAEGHAWFLRRYDRQRALQFLSLLELMTPLRVLGTSKGDQTGATEIMRSFSDQDLTLCDAVGLHLMQSKTIPSCWSTDFHLGLTGVPLVIHEN